MLEWLRSEEVGAVPSVTNRLTHTSDFTTVYTVYALIMAVPHSPRI